MILHFFSIFLREIDGGNALDVKELTIDLGETTYTVTRSEASTDNVYVTVLPNTEKQTMWLIVTEGDGDKFIAKRTAKLKAGKFYSGENLSVNMATIGDVLGSDDKFHPAGGHDWEGGDLKKVAVLTYIGVINDVTSPIKHGLCYVLEDASSETRDWNVANDSLNVWAKKNPTSLGSWRVPTTMQYESMFIACGCTSELFEPKYMTDDKNEFDYGNFCKIVSDAGGGNIAGNTYWASEFHYDSYEPVYAWWYSFSEKRFLGANKDKRLNLIRGVLAL